MFEASFARTLYLLWMDQNPPLKRSTQGRPRPAAAPMILSLQVEVVPPMGLILFSSTARHNAASSWGGSSPSHLPAAQESAICTASPAFSSSSSFGLSERRFQVFAASTAALASGFS